jgi:hypothetical protein
MSQTSAHITEESDRYRHSSKYDMAIAPSTSIRGVLYEQAQHAARHMMQSLNVYRCWIAFGLALSTIADAVVHFATRVARFVFTFTDARGSVV